MKPTTRSPSLLVLFVVAVLGLSGDHPAVQASGSCHYELTPASSYQEGCFEPCLCPIFFNPSLSGSFVLELLSQVGEVSLYEVSAINWTFTLGIETVEVTGSGLYRLEPEQHRLELELQFGDTAIRYFDSGMVARAADFPAIAIAVATNGFYCYDHVFDILSVPVAVRQDPIAWGEVKSLFR